jgi:hypothetical protein
LTSTKRWSTSGGYRVRSGTAAGLVVGGKDGVVFGSTGTVVVAGIVVEIVVGTVLLVSDTSSVMVGRGVGDTVVFDTVRFVVVFTVVFVTTSPDTVKSERRTRQARSTAGITVKSRSLPQYLRITDSPSCYGTGLG